MHQRSTVTIGELIAEAHGGQIDEASTAGSSARFAARLPIIDADQMKEEERT